MARKKTLRNDDDQVLYPISSTDCVYDVNGNTLTEVIGKVDISNIGDGTITGAIKSINQEKTELLNTVTNGKSSIAEAITNKGIHTDSSDTFENMALNIKKIIYDKNKLQDQMVLQSKIVNLDGNIKTAVITADANYDGLSKVTVTIIPQEKNIHLDYGDIVITPDDGKVLTKVVIERCPDVSTGTTTLGLNKTFMSIPQGYHNGKDVIKANIQDIYDIMYSGSKVYTPDTGRVISSVTVVGAEPVQSETRTLNLLNQSVGVDEGYHDGTGIVNVNLEELRVNLVAGDVVVKSKNNYPLAKIIVVAPEDKSNDIVDISSVTITDNNTSFNIPEDGYYTSNSKFKVPSNVLKNNALTVDGTKYTEPMKLYGSFSEDRNSVGEPESSSITLPNDFGYGSSVIYNKELHILGGSSSNTHHKLTSTGWVKVSDLPFSFSHGSAVVYNNEIHILGEGVGDEDLCHYKWNGSTWTKASTLPYQFYGGSAVVYNNEIHILGTAANNASLSLNHYKWNGSSWSLVSKLPYEFYDGAAVVYNNEIHILGGGRYYCRKYHYKWNGVKWIESCPIPYKFYKGSAIVFNNDIHVIGSYYTDEEDEGIVERKHMKYDGVMWIPLTNLLYDTYGSSVSEYNNKLYIMGTYSTTNRTTITTISAKSEINDILNELGLSATISDLMVSVK